MLSVKFIFYAVRLYSGLVVWSQRLVSAYHTRPIYIELQVQTYNLAKFAKLYWIKTVVDKYMH